MKPFFRTFAFALLGVILGAGAFVARAAEHHGHKKSEGKKQAAKAQADTPPAHVMLTPKDLKWMPGPASLPAGAQYAILDGDPKAAGTFTMRVKLPAVYKIPPHWHGSTERVTVISGALSMGKGDTFDADKTEFLPGGSFILMPARVRHFGWTKKETVVQLDGVGPWSLNYVNSADDPRKSNAGQEDAVKK